ncbi:MAG: response regulator [Acidobacteriota bacterium]
MDVARILVVEDNPDNSDLVVDVLTLRGHEVIQAANGREGVEMARVRHPDLILMDISLPIVDGFAATEEIKRDPQLKPVPVIALTAHAMAGDEKRALAAGCNGYITKPIDIKTFANRIQAFLKGPSNA